MTKTALFPILALAVSHSSAFAQTSASVSYENTLLKEMTTIKNFILIRADDPEEYNKCWENLEVEVVGPGYSETGDVHFRLSTRGSGSYFPVKVSILNQAPQPQIGSSVIDTGERVNHNIIWESSTNATTIRSYSRHVYRSGLFNRRYMDTEVTNTVEKIADLYKVTEIHDDHVDNDDRKKICIYAPKK